MKKGPMYFGVAIGKVPNLNENKHVAEYSKEHF